LAWTSASVRATNPARMVIGPVTATLEGVAKAIAVAEALIKLYAARPKAGRKGETRPPEVESLTRALGIEVAALVIAVAERHAWWLREWREDPAWLPPLVPFYAEAYDRLATRLESLPPPMVAAVVHFYGYLHFVNGLQAARDEYQRAGKHEKYFPAYAEALRDLFDVGRRALGVFARDRGLDVKGLGPR
jgi:hypothetical protein